MKNAKFDDSDKLPVGAPGNAGCNGKQSLSPDQYPGGSPGLGGLSPEEVILRRKQYGTNDLPVPKLPSILSLFLQQIKNPINYFILVAAIFKLIFEGVHDAALMTTLLFVSACIGAFYERRAQKIVLSLRKFVSLECIAIRNGCAVIIHHAELVPGDIIVVQEGNSIPADAKLLESAALRTDESLLTGESEAIDKKPGDLLYRGTVVTSGHGRAIVCAIGTKTAMGEIQTSMQTFSQQSPFHREVERLSHYLLIGSGILVSAFLVTSLTYGYSFLEALYLTTSLLVCIVPEGIPIVSAIVLAISGYRMAQLHVVVKHGAAIDALGRINVLLTDKTGTLTRNEQMVVALMVDEKEYTVTGSGYEYSGAVFCEGKPEKQRTGKPVSLIGLLCALFDDTERTVDPNTGQIRIKGEPLHAAFGVLGSKLGWTRENIADAGIVRQKETPFSPATRLQHLEFLFNNSAYEGTIGSPEEVLAYLQESKNTKVLARCEELLKRGLRVIVCALKKQSDDTVFVIGVLGLEDAIRPGSRMLVEKLHTMGTQVIVATGDHPTTAEHVAHAVGLLEEGVAPLRGSEVRQLESKALVAQVTKTPIIACVTPKDKAQLVLALKQQGYCVGMIGDGVNDAPALIAADVGIAMGKSGTDVAQEAADIVLLDDSLSSTVEGIIRGRHVTCLMRQVILYLLTTNGGEVIAIFGALFLTMPLPLDAVQILWINFITDGFLDIALGMEPYDESRKNAQPCRLIDRSFAWRMLTSGVPMAIGTLWLFYIHLPEGLVKARTVALVTLALFQWFNAWNLRSDDRSLFSLSFFSNRWLVAVTALVIGLQACALYLPFMNKLLKTVPLGPIDLLEVFCVAATIIVVEELRKLLNARRR